MPSTSPEADTAAWRDLLPWATPEERRSLLDSENLAALYFGELVDLDASSRSRASRSPRTSRR
jgi:hypothetical protein